VGSLTVGAPRGVWWLCKCDCGKLVLKPHHQLIHGICYCGSRCPIFRAKVGGITSKRNREKPLSPESRGKISETLSCISPSPDSIRKRVITCNSADYQRRRGFLTSASVAVIRRHLRDEWSTEQIAQGFQRSTSHIQGILDYSQRPGFISDEKYAEALLSFLCYQHFSSTPDRLDIWNATCCL